MRLRFVSTLILISCLPSLIGAQTLATTIVDLYPASVRYSCALGYQPAIDYELSAATSSLSLLGGRDSVRVRSQLLGIADSLRRGGSCRAFAPDSLTAAVTRARADLKGIADSGKIGAPFGLRWGMSPDEVRSTLGSLQVGNRRHAGTPLQTGVARTSLAGRPVNLFLTFHDSLGVVEVSASIAQESTDECVVRAEAMADQISSRYPDIPRRGGFVSSSRSSSLGRCDQLRIGRGRLRFEWGTTGAEGVQIIMGMTAEGTIILRYQSSPGEHASRYDAFMQTRAAF